MLHEKFLKWLTPTIAELELTRFDQAAARRAQTQLMTLADGIFW